MLYQIIDNISYLVSKLNNSPDDIESSGGIGMTTEQSEQLQHIYEAIDGIQFSNVKVLINTTGRSTTFPVNCKVGLAIVSHAYMLDNASHSSDAISGYNVSNAENYMLLSSFNTCPAMRVILILNPTTSTTVSFTTQLSYQARIMLIKLS